MAASDTRAMRRWTRVTPPAVVVPCAIWLVFFFVCFAVIAWGVMFDSAPILGGAVGPVGGLILVVAVAWRALLIGVWIGDTAVRHRSLVLTRTIPWSAIARLESRTPIMGYTSRPRKQVIWVVFKEGSERMFALWDPDTATFGRGRPLGARTERYFAVTSFGVMSASEQRAHAALRELRQALHEHS